MNIFEKDGIDWKELVKNILWNNIVFHKNEYSGYDIVVGTGNVIKTGSVLSSGRKVRRLNWKELALVLGFWKEELLEDGHDCEKCPCEKVCNAYFKYDKEQEGCIGWKENMDVKPVEERYKEFMDTLSVVPSIKTTIW